MNLFGGFSVASGVLACMCLAQVGCGSGDATTWMDAARAREATVGQVFETARTSATSLDAFLRPFPKGADLHTHLSGAIHTEGLIALGAADGLCVKDADATAVAAPCAAGTKPLSQATSGSALYQTVLSAWSMEGFTTAPLAERHDHFFATFNKFGAITGNPAHGADMVDDVVRRAASLGVVHIELLASFNNSAAGSFADANLDKTATWDDAFLLKARETIAAAPAVQAALASSVTDLNTREADLQKRWRCDQANRDPACDVTVRYVLQSSRTRTREYVLGQFVFAFELAQRDPRFVGINIVQTEEDMNSLLYYDQEMTALRVLGQHNRTTAGRKPVHISLHAGELTPALLPMTAEGQRHIQYHIRRAVEVAGAERIGHGVDVLMESEGAGRDPMMLLQAMAQKGVAVELCLTSNQQLLGVEGAAHPTAAYVAAGVPYALSTDDEGVLRSDILQEYKRAAQVQGLSYAQLKASARHALEHSFLAGSSLWKDARAFTPVGECMDSDPAQPASLSATCAGYLMQSERAAQQWALEKRLATFEVQRTATR